MSKKSEEKIFVFTSDPDRTAKARKAIEDARRFAWEEKQKEKKMQEGNRETVSDEKVSPREDGDDLLSVNVVLGQYLLSCTTSTSQL